MVNRDPTAGMHIYPIGERQKYKGMRKIARSTVAWSLWIGSTMPGCNGEERVPA